MGWELNFPSFSPSLPLVSPLSKVSKLLNCLDWAAGVLWVLGSMQGGRRYRSPDAYSWVLETSSTHCRGATRTFARGGNIIFCNGLGGGSPLFEKCSKTKVLFLRVLIRKKAILSCCMQIWLCSIQIDFLFLCFYKSWFFSTNLNIPVPLSLQPGDVNL